MATLERAIALATQAHAGQVDNGGSAYIQHPLRVMEKVETPEQRIVAVLHDVLEETPLTAVDLARAGFNLRVISALLSLKQRNDEHYDAFVARLGNDPLAREVKLADLSVHSDVSAVANLLPADRVLLNRYQQTSAYLQALC